MCPHRFSDAPKQRQPRSFSWWQQGLTQAVDICQPLFDAMGQRTFRFGEKASDANLVKLSGNFLIVSTIEALSEAMALIGKGGLDQREYFGFSDLHFV